MEKLGKDARQLASLLGPYAAEDMVIWPLDKRVGDLKNKEPAVIEPYTSPG
jgi:putative SOS response-associated peptidase YedK